MNKQQHLYSNLWKMYIPDILDMVEVFPSNLGIELSKNEFNAVGNREDYCFRLELKNGKIANNIQGSAVARDLAELLLADSRAKRLFAGKTVIIRLLSNYQLVAEVNAL
ncbi:hypothetical protein [Chitinophaga rhizosphaerae]|uniref:hypothetical protein n=1 Tax=Chitinophaga rhizosphaerae TaxID=1864947 RepID=UPI000F80442D|nr:hypothetical protein [Chitinophaga rhizosphaerae]